MRVLERQSLLDIAMQYCGDASAAFAIAVLNGISASDGLIVDSELLLPDVIDSDVVKYYINNDIQPATTVTDREMNAQLGGLGFMSLGIDFIVS